MSRKRGRPYTPKFKFQVVLEALRSERTEAEVARAYQVHPVTLSKWKKQFLEKGCEVFAGKESDREYEKRIAELERMVGRKELEIALLKNFLEGS
ncbi:MAG TPA: transposase [Acidobacteriota bacterium]|nr:transposase [Acidobacteriota bacterium]